MKLIVGLGNPGLKYHWTRHNVGFLAIDRLLEHWGSSPGKVRDHGDVYESSFNHEKIFLVKPKTYMNLSGKCVSPLFNFYLKNSADCLVIHDDLDLKEFSLRIKKGGGSGGHRGLKSIDESLGKEKSDYYRIRIGVGHPHRLEDRNDLKFLRENRLEKTEEKKIERLRHISPADYVLMPYQKEEVETLMATLDDTVILIEMILEGRVLEAMNRFHGSLKRKKNE